MGRFEPEKAPPSVTIEQSLFEQLQRDAKATRKEIEERVKDAVTRGTPRRKDDPTYEMRATKKPHTNADKYKLAPMPSDADIDRAMAQIRRKKDGP